MVLFGQKLVKLTSERRTEITELPERVFGENTQIQLHIDRKKLFIFLGKQRLLEKRVIYIEN